MSAAEPKPLAGRAMVNAGSQMAGRIFLSGVRFLVMLIVVRRAGVALFGEFALILTLVLFSEVLADFGMNDVAVRELGEHPGHRSGLLGGLFLAKSMLVVIAAVTIITALIVLRYPRDMIEGALAALPAIACYGGVLLFRLGLKSKLRMEKEVASESVSVVATLPLYWLASRPGVPLFHLTAIHSLSRLVFLTVLFLSSRAEIRHPLFQGAWSQVRHLARLAYPIGIALLVACSYDGIDLIFLSKLRSARDVGLYSGSMRFIQLSIMLIYPVADTAFPLLVAGWHESKERFREILRTTFRLAVFLAGGAFCVLACGAHVLLHTVSREMLEAERVLEVLACVAFGRAVMTMMQPLLIVTRGMKHALWLTGVGISLKLVLLWTLIPKWGPLGAAVTNVVGEFVSVCLASAIIQHLIGFRLHWPALVGVILAAGASLGSVYALGLWGGWLGTLLAAALYCALTVWARIVPLGQLGEFAKAARLRFGKPRAPQPA